MKTPVTCIVVGAGSRGDAYGSYALRHPEEGRVTAVCEPREDRRRLFAKAHGLPADRCFADWREIADRPRLADAAFVCTVEDQHRDIVVALADKGYAILLEKPMAPTEQACRDIVDAARRTGILLTVCHVLRYAPHVKRLKALLDEGCIGPLRHIAGTEHVGPWHFAHSFVRGNFRNEQVASPLLLAKCCHDMDLLTWLMPTRCTRVSSFGRVSLFRRERQPEGAADRCMDCPAHIESACPYSALKIYLRDRLDGLDLWPVSMVTTDATPRGVAQALETGPYGRCVYACDNDAPDHQGVSLEFEDGATAGFIVTAFAEGGRDYHLMGDRGSLRLNNDGLHHHDFLTDRTRTIPVDVGDNTQVSGHGGADDELVRHFLAAVRDGDTSRVSTGADVSLTGHLIVFAAEQARRCGTVEAVVRQ